MWWFQNPKHYPYVIHISFIYIYKCLPITRISYLKLAMIILIIDGGNQRFVIIHIFIICACKWSYAFLVHKRGRAHFLINHFDFWLQSQRVMMLSTCHPPRRTPHLHPHPLLWWSWVIWVWVKFEVNTKIQFSILYDTFIYQVLYHSICSKQMSLSERTICYNWEKKKKKESNRYVGIQQIKC